MSHDPIGELFRRAFHNERASDNFEAIYQQALQARARTDPSETNAHSLGKATFQPHQQPTKRMPEHAGTGNDTKPQPQLTATPTASGDARLRRHASIEGCYRRMVDHPEPPTQSPWPPRRIVVVDDHSAMREVLRSLLEDVGGWEVVGEAGSGEEAIPLIERLQPDVVLLDCKLPGQGGVATTREIVWRWPHIPVVAHTGYADEAYVREMVAAGAKGYILKGDAPTALLEALNVAVQGGARLSAEVASPVLEDLRALYEAALDRTKQLETEHHLLRQAVTRLGQSNQLSDQFVIAVHAELIRSANVLLKVPALLQQPHQAATGKQRALLGLLQEQGGQLLGMVDRLMRTSALLASDRIHTTEPVPIAALLANLIANRQPTASTQSCAIHVRFPQQPRPLLSNAEALRIVLDIVLEHACLRTPPSSSVEVAVEQTADSTWVLIADQGSRLLSRGVKQAFGVLSQAVSWQNQGSRDQQDAERNGVFELLLADRLVQGLGGRAWVEDNPAGGVRFVIEFCSPPAEDPAGTEATPRSAPNPPAASSKRRPATSKQPEKQISGTPSG